MATTRKPELPAQQASAKQESGKRAAARRMTQRARAEDEERYALALESINHGVYDWDIINNTVYYSPLLRAIYGMTDDQVLTPEESGQRIHPDDIEQYRRGECADRILPA